MSIPAALWIVSLPVAIVLALAFSGRSASPHRLLLACACATAGGGLAGDALDLALQLDLRSWVRAPARVVESERGEGRNDWRFAYEYSYAGELHRASRLTYAPHLRSRADTDSLAETYPVGRAIEVYVDPDDPARASVEAEPRLLLPLAGIAIHGLLAAAVVARLRDALARPAA